MTTAAHIEILVRDLPHSTMLHSGEIECQRRNVHLIEIPLQRILEAPLQFPGHSGLAVVEFAIRFDDVRA